MKTSLEHLPEHKQQELQAIAELIKKAYKVEMIILFGSYARGNWVEDIHNENGTIVEYESDYDLLVILTYEDYTTQLGIEKKLKENLLSNHKVETPVSLIFHGIKQVNRELREGNYFFSDIKKEGILLYNSEKYKLAERKELTSEEIKQKATNHFEQWFESANNFYTSFEDSFKREHLKEAAFLLHQATERYYVTILLVFTDYRPKQHNLEILGQQAETLDKRFKAAFPKTTAEEKHLFELLKRAYIDARYKMKEYNISKEELEYLSKRVKLLKELTEKICKEKMESIN